MPAKKVVPASHPKYEEMIAAAIHGLKTRGGASRHAIKKYIVSNYQVNYETFDRSFRTAVKKGVESGIFIQNKQSFRLSPTAARKAGASEKKSNKPAGEKKVRKSRSKSPAKMTKIKETPKK